MLAELKFDGKAVVVTGAASGIGRAAALVLGELGAHVYALDRNGEGLTALAKNAEAASFRCTPVTADVTSEADAAKLHDRLAADGVVLKALVNNVGTNRHMTLQELPLAVWNELITLNLTSAFLITRALLPLLLAAPKGGAVVNVSSGYGMIGGPKIPVYAATKAGLIGLTRQISHDYAPQGLRVNAVCPGLTLTDRVRGYLDQGLLDAEAQRSRTLSHRFAEPREIANVIAFLASDAASFMTGAVVPVEGGQTAT